MNQLALFLTVFASFCIFTTESSVVPDEDWGYALINPQYQSQMFWWLYGADNPNRDSLPLVIWLQGGPGASSLFGDFDEVGPLDSNLQPRKYTWIQSANMLFVDNPIGTGFSYTNSPNGYSTTDDDIAANLVKLLQIFVQKYPIFQKNPLWIWSESYGGKMTSKFGVALDKAIKSSAIKVNFAGVSLGDGWVSPVDCMYSYVPFLQATSLVDEQEAAAIKAYADSAQAALNSGNGLAATQAWGNQQAYMDNVTGGVNVYNFLTYYDYTPDITELMNGKIRSKLGIIPNNVTWGMESDQVFESMMGDFMKPSYSDVDYLLNAGYKVNVYGGQLDIIVDILCIEAWLDRLNWSGMSKFQQSPRVVYEIDQTPTGALKSYQNFSLWNIYNASHMVPYDVPEMALAMFQTVIGQTVTVPLQIHSRH